MDITNPSNTNYNATVYANVYYVLTGALNLLNTSAPVVILNSTGTSITNIPVNIPATTVDPSSTLYVELYGTNTSLTDTYDYTLFFNGITPSHMITTLNSAIIGPTGPQGIQGIQGETGPTGPQGQQGYSTGRLYYLNYSVTGTLGTYSQLGTSAVLNSTQYTSNLTLPTRGQTGT
ncbi:MAG: collagen-like protein, partial [Micrococcales bacterium]|nr:collagen-like protein [Micrococcales bacterium]